MTREEAIDEGYKVYSEAQAREIIADDIFDTLMNDHGSLWDIVLQGHTGVNELSRSDIEEYFVDNIDEAIIFECNLEEQQ